ncbi:MAG: M28 family peptidase, partial [Acidobacteriota bacterium]
VGVVLNFEARGTRGPSLMFETSAGNAPLIRELRRAAPFPAAASYTYEVYKALPNDTDFSVFRRAGLVGMNFAFIEGPGYHSPGDSLAALDLASVQHHGETALSLARHLAELDLSQGLEGADAVYFNLLGPLLVVYSSTVTWTLVAVAALLLVSCLVVGFRRRRLAVGGLLLAVLAVFFCVGTVASLLLVLAPWIISTYNFTLWFGWTSGSLNPLALGLVAAGLALAGWRLFASRLRGGHLIMAGGIWWFAMSLTVTMLAPGASYLFLIPLVAALAGAFAWLRADESTDRLPLPLTASLWAVVILTALLWPVNLRMIGLALGEPAAPALGLLVTMICLGVLPTLWELCRPLSWRLPSSLLAVGLALIALVASGSSYGPVNPKPTSLLYELDTETGTARWFSIESEIDDWTRQVLTAQPKAGKRSIFFGWTGPGLEHPAPVASLGGAEIEVLAAPEGAPDKSLDLAIRWPFDVDRAVLYLRSKSEIEGIRIGNERFERSANAGPGKTASRMILVFTGVPADGMSLSVDLVGEDPLSVEAFGQRFGLPRLEGVDLAPKPAHLQTRSGWNFDSTFVRSLTNVTRHTSAQAN